MDSGQAFGFDHARHTAASGLRPEHYAEFQRLAKHLGLDRRFRLLIVECPHEGYRDILIGRLDAVLAQTGARATRVLLDRDTPADFAAVEIALIDASAGHAAVHLLGADAWFHDDARLDAFNIRREAITRSVPACVLLWSSAALITRLATQAPDLWSWRTGVFAFTLPDVALPLPESSTWQGPIDTRTLAERTRRIAELRAVFADHPTLADGIRLPLLDELVELHFSLGELDEALRIRREEELPVYERLGDVRSYAITQGKIAGLLQTRGMFDEALRIYREEALPVFERLGDVRTRAVTLGKIADMLQVRGAFDEALRIYREEQLPVYERLGDVHARAVTFDKIADVLQVRGEFDEVLRIRREEELPVFERLGDVRAKAITQGKIADILEARGAFDEALRIHRDEELPVYERLGDLRNRAITVGKIADILRTRGELDAALRIRREEELPVYERLGDVRNRAIALSKIADVLKARDAFDEALHVYRDEALPVFVQLGDPRCLLVCRTNIATTLLKRGYPDDRDEAERLLRQALAAASAMQLPEATQITEILRKAGFG